MEQRRLGRTDIMVSSICLGTMTFGEQNTEAEGHAQMDRAVERGVNFFDAAELYPIPPSRQTQGRTERIIGTWFKARGNRDKIIMATKVVGRTDMNWFRHDGSTGKLVRWQIEQAVDRSLRNLQTDYIDLYQIHWPDRHVSAFGANPARWQDVEPATDETPIGETLKVLTDLVKAGKIREIGLSNESSWGTMTYLHEAEKRNAARVVSIQNGYSLVNRTFETNLAEVALRENVGLLAYSALGQGYLSGKYRNGMLPKGARKTLFNRLQRYEKPGAEAAINAYLDLADEFGLDPSQMALAFALNRSFMTSVIIGATSMEQLELNLQAVNVDITPELQERIDAIHQLTGNPCP
ncbi:aryl-alcohol dehydrogenase-like predicted oxidoreductase [Roseibium hamelinense]|uniref:Aryl-alcohol dehydrogenase-like predicted oxidoreductase n=1 Tax=Roseibium hamelinense TaxID=150831 RepID=A0A562SL87_9HYPH|nr:aldo/keto reductase [Roseibium hamelinense]MTI43426.1 aldo/keto reductase [Roseibium hamelinense]TWI81883.1 aryl-alcohol dehydrogenase-like predicted oxidoreductase [Roseibium hamelinense]